MTAVAKLPGLPEMSTLVRMNVAGSDDVILVLGYTAEQMDAYARAALSPAELGGVALTTSFVQEVPDKCDRIVWRGHYYHLPVNSESTPRAAEAVSEKTNKAVADLRWLCRYYDQFVPIRHLSLCLDRLEAALTPPSAKGE